MSECPGCGSGEPQERFRFGEHAVLECPVCGLQFSHPPPSAAEVPELYSEAYFTGSRVGYEAYLSEEATHRRQARRYLARLARDARPPGPLLDVGCAAGFFLDEARRAGWQVRGCEVSDWAARHAREALGLEVQAADILEADLPAGVFGLVTFINSFEHVRDPAAAAARAAALVRPGGIVALETWDCRSAAARAAGRGWHQYQPPYTVCYLSRPSLLRLFPAPGWRLLRYGAATKWITLRRGFEILRDSGPPALRRVFAGFSRSAAAALEVPYRAGDLVWAVLRREAPRGT